jgi:hypothetical protein
MVIVLTIVSMVAVFEAIIIFFLRKVLKNTFSILDEYIDGVVNDMPKDFKTAYNGVYIPATVIVQLNFECDQYLHVVDWSMYEDKKIVGFITNTTQTPQAFFGQAATEDELEELKEPMIIPNAVVYEVKEGVWYWKPSEKSQ